MSDVWTAETILAAAAADEVDRITVDADRMVRIDGRVATTSELRLLASMCQTGQVDLNTLDPADGARCCWATRSGKRLARRWGQRVGAAS